MKERGVTSDEIEITINKGKHIQDAKEGTFGKTYVFTFNEEWEGSFYAKKEVVVYYKIKDKSIILLTVISRYGDSF